MITDGLSLSKGDVRFFRFEWLFCSEVILSIMAKVELAKNAIYTVKCFVQSGKISFIMA